MIIQLIHSNSHKDKQHTNLINNNNHNYNLINHNLKQHLEPKKQTIYKVNLLLELHQQIDI